MSPEEIYIRTAENMHRVEMCARNTSEATTVLLPKRIYLEENIYTIAMCVRNHSIIRLL
jgi:hypothetical protein